MKTKFKKAFNELVKMGAPVFSKYSDGTPIEGGTFKISAETDSEFIVDYYSFAFGHFGVDLAICKVLDKYGLHAEWDNPGCLTVWD